MNELSIGSIVKCRNREWVLLPSHNKDLYLLRPLTGSEEEICGIDRRFANFGFDKVEPSHFPLPNPQDSSDFVGTELLWNAARLSLRDGAGPFRSFGKISVRPRAYQLVPLIMSLRLDPIRLFIADDVGVGKTIEALLIVRELIDRGEIRRFCVLCPPYLCDQWQREIQEKFHLEAVVIRSGTISQLESNLPSQDVSIFEHYLYTVISIDYAKSDMHKYNFLIHCPELVIVDEAHGAAQPVGNLKGQQQRHELLKSLVNHANGPDRHLILLTATPHSGVEESFLSLLGLLKPEFSSFNLSSLSDEQRDELAGHFAQRRRADIQQWIGEETPFPSRESVEVTYELSESYCTLFDRVYAFSSEIVRSGETLSGWKKRIRYWTALALLRCVMSSPEAAYKALSARGKRSEIEADSNDENYSPFIFEDTENETIDIQPTHIVEEAEGDLNESEKRRLANLAKLAANIKGEADAKLKKCTGIVRQLIINGFQPIVWCRYIATSDYVASEMSKRLEKDFPELRILSITGLLTEEERRRKIKELAGYKSRVLVATDCLSEGINLQEHFNAVIHYDLPWNPNRLEQREGRVDRFGQTTKTVKTFLLYGRDNAVDGAVLNVLLRKAKEIRNTLGISVPVPVDSETVIEAVLKALFFRGPQTSAEQLRLFEDPTVLEFHSKLYQQAEREKSNRTRFAQRAIRPDEVKKELDETDYVLGDPSVVERFIINACQRFQISINSKSNKSYLLTGLNLLPEPVRFNISDINNSWLISFVSPPPEGATFLGRNHPFVTSLARFLLEEALTKGGSAHAPRCGVIRTSTVSRRIFLLLLRNRFSLIEPNKTPILAEEAIILGLSGLPPQKAEWLNEDDVLSVLSSVSPQSNISSEEKREVLEELLSNWQAIEPGFKPILEKRAQKLADAHRRVRAAARLKLRGFTVAPYFPADLLGVLVLLPVPKGVLK